MGVSFPPNTDGQAIFHRKIVCKNEYRFLLFTRSKPVQWGLFTSTKLPVSMSLIPKTIFALSASSQFDNYRSPAFSVRKLWLLQREHASQFSSEAMSKQCNMLNSGEKILGYIANYRQAVHRTVSSYTRKESETNFSANWKLSSTGWSKSP